MHPTDQKLEAFCEGTLPSGERSGLESHLVACPRCRNEVEDWRSLFVTLSTLPQFSPAPGFVGRVMAHIRIPRPWYQRAGALAARLVPRTTPGWAFAVALLAIPALLAGGLAFWLLTRSYLSAATLWAFAYDSFLGTIGRWATGVIALVLQTDIMAWLVRAVGGFLTAAGLRGLGTVAAGTALLTLISIWVLYRYLIRTPTRGSTYVTYSF